MFSLRTWLVEALCVMVIAACAVAGAEAQSATPKKHPGKHVTASSHKKATHHKSRKSHRVASWRRGQQKIRPERAREIQDALVREHYLKSQPSGVWDDATQSAMQRYQADHGWQTKVIPDSRALIGLGLGPDHEHLLNPESAMTGVPITKDGGAEDSNSTKNHPASPEVPSSTVFSDTSTPAGDAKPAQQAAPAEAVPAAAHP